jgi:hypothetical protein
MDKMPPPQILWGMINSNVLARCVQVVAEYGVADALADRPMTITELAAQTGMNEDALARMLRLLVAHDVFTQQEDNLYRQTPLSELLRTDHPHSMSSFARMMNLPIFMKSFAGLTETAKTGEPIMDFAGFMEYFAAKPEESSIFNQAMADKSRNIIPAVLAAYDFSPFGVIADIGGGRGHLLSGILEQTPTASGILFDLPHVVQEASDHQSAGLKLQPGDFFADALPTADAYMLMEVIHDWNDEESVRILSAIRRAAPSHARLLIVEAIVSDSTGADFSKTLDVIMLAITGGRERTPSQYKDLLSRAGFRLERIITTPSQYSIIETVVI